MSKSFSAARPQTFERYDAGHILVAYNVEELTSEEGEKSFQFDTLIVNGEPTKEAIVNTLIREKYSQSEVEAIMRHKLNGDEGADVDFSAFNAFAEACKATAREIFESNE